MDQQTFASFVMVNGIIMRATFEKYVPSTLWPVSRWGHFVWSVCLECEGRTFTTPYRTGLAHCTRVSDPRNRRRTVASVQADHAIARALKPHGRLSVDDVESMRVVPTEPTIVDVLYSLQSDAHTGDQSFEDFCDCMGLDTDSRKAYAMWEACVSIRHALRKLMGAPSRFEALMACVEE